MTFIMLQMVYILNKCCF